MFTRRRASPQELEEGNRQMQQAQQRLDAEIAAGSELTLEDVKGMETVTPSPFAALCTSYFLNGMRKGLCFMLPSL
jgi:hypothetical protein